MPKRNTGKLSLLVFADSHGNPRPMLDAVARHPDAAACFFLGDGDTDIDTVAAAYPALPMYTVGGNCDFAGLNALEGLAPFGGLLFYFTHGHAFGVKQDLDRLWWAARHRGADAALFGHTHTPYHEDRDGIHLFNPGSIARPRFGGPTYGLITVAAGRADYVILHSK